MAVPRNLSVARQAEMRRRAAWDRQWNRKLRSWQLARTPRRRQRPRVWTGPRLQPSRTRGRAVLIRRPTRVLPAPKPVPVANPAVSIVKRGTLTYTTYGKGPTYVSGLDDLDTLDAEIEALELQANQLAGL